MAVKGMAPGDPWLMAVSPRKLGMPEKYTEWRAAQAQAVVDLAESEERFSAIDAPVGAGKSGIGMAFGLLERHRVVYLTSTKNLQRQLLMDGYEGLVLAQGRNNFGCADPHSLGMYTCEENGRWCQCRKCVYSGERGHYKVCNAHDCDGWAGSCPYKQQYQEALRSSLVVTNYSYWMALNRHGAEVGLGGADLLICDEAHNAPDEVCRAMATTITQGDLGLVSVPIPKHPRDPEAWREWAEEAITDLAMHPVGSNGDTRPTKAMVKLIARREKLAGKLATIKGMYGDWVASSGQTSHGGHGWTLEPVWARQHAESVLFCGVKRVVLMSGTMTRKTMALLGVSVGDYDLLRYPYVFPKKSNPVYHIKTAVINKNTKPEGLETWRRTILNILRKRKDRKGIVHTVSYRRAEELMEYIQREDPDIGAMCLMHDSKTTAQVAATYKNAKHPCFLLSPAVTTGYDFPYEECEFIVIVKLPFPVMQTAANEFRANQDRNYAGYVMCQELVQSAGRGMRAADDRCEVFIVDDSWFWVSKRYGKSFLPSYFNVRTMDYIPNAPLPLREWRKVRGELEEAPR